MESGKQTNADRIRNMSDEELAEWINTKSTCEQCAYEPENLCIKPRTTCTNGILKWLQSEAEQERTQSYQKVRNNMRIFKSVDEKLKEIGFNKICEDKYGAQYERYNTKYNYWQCVDIWH